MNKTPIIISAITITCALTWFTACATAKESSSQGSAKAQAAASDGYKAGFGKGKQDGVGGLSRTPARWSAEYSEANRKEFFRGYEDGYNQGIRPGVKIEPAEMSYGRPLTAVSGKGSVAIKEGKRTVAVCKTASPYIEETRFIEEQNKIVVKSRGNHGPATVELFNAHTGKLEGTVKAYEIRNGNPKWAAGMGE